MAISGLRKHRGAVGVDGQIKRSRRLN